jgi:hypothetical protein
MSVSANGPKMGPFKNGSVKFILYPINFFSFLQKKVANFSKWGHTMRAVLKKWAPADWLKIDQFQIT